MMDGILAEPAIIGGIVAVLGALLALIATVLIALRGEITRIVRRVGDAIIWLIEEQTGLASEERARRTADDIVAAVEQMYPAAAGAWKLQQALELAAREGEAIIGREDIEAALKRAQGWGSGWLAAMEPRAEGSD